MTKARKGDGDAKPPARKIKETGVLVSVADSHIERMPEVAEGLRDAGLHVDQVMNFSGIITGSADAKKLDALKGVAGVANVELERSVQLPPPESDIQ